MYAREIGFDPEPEMVMLCTGSSLSAASTHVWNAVLLHTFFPFHLVNKVTHLLNTGSGVIVSWVGETCTDWNRRVGVRAGDRLRS